MKKRTLFLAMTALMITMTSGGSLTAVYADEIPTEAAETSESTELPIKPLTAKIVDENPYMAKSDANIHHDGYNTDSTDEILPLGIYPEINVSFETTNPNASPAIYFDNYGHAVVPLLGGIAIRDLNARRSAIFHRCNMMAAVTSSRVPTHSLTLKTVSSARRATTMY